MSQHNFNLFLCFQNVDLWDNFLEMRIRLQKALLVANRLPQKEQIEEFNSSGDKNLKDVYKQGIIMWEVNYYLSTYEVLPVPLTESTTRKY